MDAAQMELYKNSCVYASLVLLDSNKKITADLLDKVLKAAGSQVETYFARIFANAISQCNPETLIKFTPSPSSATAATSQGQAASQTTAPKETKAEETKSKPAEEVEEEEEDDENAFANLFG